MPSYKVSSECLYFTCLLQLFLPVSLLVIRLSFSFVGRAPSPPQRQHPHQPTGAASASFVLWLSSSSWFVCCWCDTCSSSVVGTTNMIQDMIRRVRIYILHISAIVDVTRVYVASSRHTLSAAYGSFDYRRLPPSGFAPCILLLR